MGIPGKARLRIAVSTCASTASALARTHPSNTRGQQLGQKQLIGDRANSQFLAVFAEPFGLVSGTDELFIQKSVIITSPFADVYIDN